jgi:hypothetical protein
MEHASAFTATTAPYPRHAARPDAGHRATQGPPAGHHIAHGGFPTPPVPPVQARSPLRARDRAQDVWAGNHPGQPEPTPFEEALPDLRGHVVDRLQELNWVHAQVAWERRRRDPIGPHALLLLFADPDQVGGFGLRVGCRNFFGTDETRLAHLLHDMTTVITAHLAAGNDLRTHAANWTDSMTPQAFYLGLAVSTLDTPDLTWEQAQQDANSDMDVPGRAYVTLRDSSHLLINRASVNDFGDLTIASTVPPERTSTHLRRRWYHDSDLTDRHREQPVWQQLGILHRLILRGPHAH